MYGDLVIRKLLADIDASDAPVFVLLIGFVSVAVGIALYSVPACLIVAGAILILYVKPLWRWFK